MNPMTHPIPSDLRGRDWLMTQDWSVAEIETALEHHELIKVKLRADRAQRAQWAEEIRTGSGAEVVHSIGQVVSLYRRNPKKTVIELPA